MDFDKELKEIREDILVLTLQDSRYLSHSNKFTGDNTFSKPVTSTAATSTMLSNTFITKDRGDELYASIDSAVNFRGAWNGSTSYSIGDIVSYLGSSFVSKLDSNDNHTPNSDSDTDYWDMVAKAGSTLVFMGPWSGNETTYSTNDVVSYLGSSFVALQDTTSSNVPSSSADTAYWRLLVRGLKFMGAWSNVIAYYTNDIVSYLGSSFAALQNNSGQTPPIGNSGSSYWTIVSKAPTFMGVWTSSTSYSTNDIVSYLGSSFIALQTTTGSDVPSASADTDFWALVAKVGNDGASGSSGGLSQFADFYSLMPGDNTATIATGAPVLFTTLGLHKGTDIEYDTSSNVNIVTPGIYEVIFQVSVAEAGQLVVALNATEIPYTLVGRATGTSQICGMCLVETTIPDTGLTIRNPSGSEAALTLTPNAGGAAPHAVSCHLVIKQLSVTV